MLKKKKRCQKKLDHDVSTVSSENESEVSAKKTKFLGSFIYKDSFRKIWARLGYKSFFFVKMGIYSFM